MSFDTVSDKFTYITLIIYAVFITIEFIFTYFSRKNTYSVRDTFVNLLTGLFALYLPYLAAIAILSFLYQQLHPHSIFPLKSAWKGLINEHHFYGWTFLFLVLCDDLSYYIYHRASHMIRFLWCIHEVHHSSEQFNLSVYFRASFLEYVFQGIFWIPMILLGFDIDDMIFQMGISLFYQFWIHTQFTKKIPVIDLFINVPRHHRVHHARNIPYLDRNFGAILIIWDKLFGTFNDEIEAPAFGVLSPPKSFNPIKVSVHAFIALFKDVSACQTGFFPRMLYFLAPPGWRHDGLGQTTKTLQGS